jgi:hypothetical protein
VTRTLALVLTTAALLGALAGPAAAGPVPTYCELLDLLGYEHVRECQDPVE